MRRAQKTYPVGRGLHLPLHVQCERMPRLCNVETHVSAIAIQAAAIEAAQADVDAQRLVLESVGAMSMSRSSSSRAADLIVKALRALFPVDGLGETRGLQARQISDVWAGHGSRCEYLVSPGARNLVRSWKRTYLV